MLFGRKKKEDVVEAMPIAAEISEPPASLVPQPSEIAPVATPLPTTEPAPPPAQAPVPVAAPVSVTVTPDYASARVIAANHLIVNAGQDKLVLDIARELSGGTDKRMPVDTRVVMTVATAQRLQAALAQALAQVQ
ncbi:MAG: hypothetical protein DVB23_000936 [Verrucomicrobia bacterium]|nr:MAG: hypothetical protein DVB23_000936 [Verrucomicrobiota bacterium]